MPAEVAGEIIQRPVVEEYCIVLVRVRKSDLDKLQVGKQVKITEVI